ncbi:hypothetical protein MKX01_033093 [Papaver californicum]|nr:hypothetical protein MKX01_033093 [Papaver californicum]
MVKRKGVQKPQTPLPVDLRRKLLKIVHHHGQLKTSFHTLKSQIKTGLLDTEEMAEEGRSSTFYMESDSIQLNFQHQSNIFVSEYPSKSSFSAEERDQVHEMEKLILKEEENYSERVRKAGNELWRNKEKIDIHVNSRQDDILETLNHHAHSIHNIFQKSASYLTNVHRINRTNNDQCETTALMAMALKLLRGIFEQMNLVSGSFEDGVKDLIRELAEQMCNAMVDYVQEIIAEIATAGTLKKLLDVVGEMDRVIVDGRSKLEEAKKEARKFEALSRLKESEEKRLALNELFGFLLKAKENSMEPFLLRQKLAALGEDQIVDKSIRSLLKASFKNSNNKVQSKFPTSPWELKTHEPLVSRGNYQNKFLTTVVELVVINQNLRRTTGSVARTLRSQMGTPGNPSSDCWPSLGSSPSVLLDHCQRKQIVQKHIPSLKKIRGRC